MPAGIEVYRSDGSLQISLTDRLSRIVGSLTLASGSGAGSVTVDLAYGTPWAVFLPIGSNAVYDPPSVVGNTISWSNPTIGVMLIYGVY